MNHLKGQTSPYLLQHAENPVDWYPWGEEAFEKAKREDKPVFLSIGYSTCHWCHVMARESFEDKDVAKLLNDKFVPVKVDREERPDIDAVYMTVCQTMTGSGGWPLSIFMTAEQKAFFAGTYYPKHSTRGMIGFLELLSAVAEAWKGRRSELLKTAESLVFELEQSRMGTGKLDSGEALLNRSDGKTLIENGLLQMKRNFDSVHGGFGMAPKFPSGHNLLFLLEYYEKHHDKDALEMAEKTLTQMYKGGIFDHLGGGFSRYSTDKYFLAPHFEKMLYDNALLIVCYGKAWELTKKKKYLDVAERTAGWILREMCGGQGGFYSSQDADSQGEEGKFYTFRYEEILELLGPEEGKDFCSHYGMTEGGNFDEKNIPHLLGHEKAAEAAHSLRKKVFQYRKDRFPLHTDDKILTAWNGMTIWAMAALYRQTRNRTYLLAAEHCVKFFLEQADESGDYSQLFTSWRDGKSSGKGFLDDYGWFTCGLLGLYEATGRKDYLEKAQRFMKRALKNFSDEKKGGFYLWGRENETLVMNPKEDYDGAVPSGNSVMAYNLVKLVHYGREETEIFETAAERQFAWLYTAAEHYPAGHCFFLLALDKWLDSSSFYVCRDGVCAPAFEKPYDDVCVKEEEE